MSHVSTEWSPTTHSSAVITTAVQGEPLLQTIIPESESSENHKLGHKPKTCDKKKQHTTTTTTNTNKPDHISSNKSPSGPTHETASPLRAILQQLWAHDPRLRNLVGGLAKASSLRVSAADSCDDHALPTEPSDEPSTQTSASGAQAAATQPHTPKVYSRPPNSGPGGHGIYNDAQGPPHDAGGDEVPARLVRGERTDTSGHVPRVAVAAVDEDHHHGSSGLGEEKGDRGSHLDDARVVSFFLEDYLRLKLPQVEAQASSTTDKQSRAAGVKPKVEEGGDKGSRQKHSGPTSGVLVDTPGTRRIFVFVDIAPTTAPSTARDLIWCLAQLARRSTLSICVASRELYLDGNDDMAIKHSEGYGDEMRGPRLAAAAAAASAAVDDLQDGDEDGDGSSTMLTVDVPASNAEDVASYIEATLLPDIEDRGTLAAKLASRSRGVMFWLEHAVAIVNDASEDGVSGEVVCSMLDDIAPDVEGNLSATLSRSRSGSSSSMMAMARAREAQDRPGQARLDDLYAWKLRRLSVGEARAALVLMQWVMLAPEALRLNELLAAIRLTMLVWPQNGDDAALSGTELISKALDVEPPMSLRDLRRRPAGGAEYVPADNPSQFWRWARRISQGLVKLDGESRTTTNSSNSKVSSEPLGLQRVVPAHESVRRFFLEGRGFQILTPAPSSPPQPGKTTKQQQPQPPPTPPTTEQLIDTSYYALLHTCLVYLNMTDFDSLSRTSTTGSHSNTASQSHLRTPSEPPSEAEEESTRLHRSNAEAQRALVTSSYPLLRYTVDNLIFHLLRPRALRYFPPQAALLRLLTADGCRIWRRWTRLLGIPDAGGTGNSSAIAGNSNSTVEVPTAVLSKARARPTAAILLRPVYGASFRLERVLKRAHKTAREQAALAARTRTRSRLRTQRSGRSIRSASGAGDNKMPPTPRTPTRPAMVRSASESSVVFALMGGGDGGGGGDDPKAHWLVPKSSPRSPTRLRSDSFGSIGGSAPLSNPASPGVLVGIQEV